MTITIAAGVPGVGSSRVCELTRRALDDGYELLNFGDVMLEEAMANELAAGRDDLRKLPLKEMKHLQRRAGEFVAERARDRDLLVDTHFVLHTAHGFVPGLPESVLREVHPDMLVLVEAPPTTIVERRAGSDHREYPTENAQTVEFHQQLNRSAAVTYSMHADAPIRVVSNEDDVDDAVERLVTMIEGISSAE